MAAVACTVAQWDGDVSDHEEGIIEDPTLRASLSGTFLQTLPDLVTPPLKGHFISAQLSTDAVSALRKVWVLIIRL